MLKLKNSYITANNWLMGEGNVFSDTKSLQLFISIDRNSVIIETKRFENLHVQLYANNLQYRPFWPK